MSLDLTCVSIRACSSSIIVSLSLDLSGRESFNSLSLNAVKSWMVDDRNVMRELYFTFGFVALEPGVSTS